MKHHPDSDDDRSFRGMIPVIDVGTPRPLWSVMVPTYHCAHYLERTLRSILQQDPGAEVMQIEVVDDHSTLDNPAEVVRRLAGDRVGFFRQTENRGVVANLNACLERSRGELIHVLHGDDLVLDGFYRTMASAFQSHRNIGAAYCRHIYIDETGAWLDIAALDPATSGILADGPRFLGSEQRIMTPCMVVRRYVYELLGAFDRRLLCAEDWEMWMRIVSQFAIYYEQQPLACYRMHANSNTGRNIRNARDLDHTRVAIEMFARYFEPPLAADIKRSAFRNYALSALDMAHRLQQQGDREGMRAQLRVAWTLNRSPRVLSSMARIAVRSVVDRWRRPPDDVKASLPSSVDPSMRDTARISETRISKSP